MNIGFVGAGNVAKSLGALFSESGNEVRYGTPNPKEGQLHVAEVCEFGEVVCFAIPFQAMDEVLTAQKDNLKDKIVVDITNAINLEDWSPIFLGEDSGGERAARLLPKSKVVKAFNTIFADVMTNDKQQIDGNKLTAFIASDDKEASEAVKRLANQAGFEGLVVEGMKNARHLEAMAHLNIAIALASGGTNAGFLYFQGKE